MSALVTGLFSAQQTSYRRLNTSETHPLSDLDEPVGDGDISKQLRSSPSRQANTRNLKLLISVSSLVINVLLLALLLRRNTIDTSQILYSPASPAIEYEPVVFSSGFGVQQSPFQGPPNQMNNKLWEDLYDFGITRITAQQAKPMANKTLPIPDEDKGYIIQLSVFHQLHCLNRLRRGIYGEVDMTNMDDHLGIEHLDHCVDTIRQGIMCHGDVTPLTFTRTAKNQPMKAVAEVVHSCRSFPRLQRWALQRRVRHNFDKSRVVNDDPLGWGGYQYIP